MNEPDLKQPKRQATVSVVVLFFKNLRTGVNIFISFFFGQYLFQVDLSSGWFQVIISLIVFALLITSILQYRRFFFYVSGQQFIIEKGVLSRDKVTIPFDRIQSVHINQNPVQRILGVVGLKVDTAGSSQKEIEIAALEGNYARNIQNFLIRMKKQNQEQEEGEEDAEWETGPSEPLVKLSPADVLRVGITENHLRNGLALMAVIFGYFWQFEEYLQRFEPIFETQKNFVVNRWLQILPLAVGVFAVVAVVLSLIQSFLRYYNLRFFIDGSGAKLISGLLRRVEYQIPRSKIQFIKWSSNPLRKLAGLRTLVVKQAGSLESSDRQSLKVPGLRFEQLQVIKDSFLPEWQSSEMVEFKASTFLIVQRSIWTGLIPALMLAGLGFLFPLFWSVAALWLLSGIYLAWRYQPTVKLACNKEMILLSKGWVFPETAALKLFKVQNVRLAQNIFQRRRKLVHLDLYTAAGRLRMLQMNEQEAREVYNYVLYRVEGTQKDWM